jgi:[protein-PII] uridylyltransferase
MTPQLPEPPADTLDDVRSRLAEFPKPPSEDRVTAARQYLARSREVVRAAQSAGASGHTIVRASSEVIDRLLRGLFESVIGDIQGLPPLALVAVGGYGRMELAPRSDIDLLVLHADGVDEPMVAKIAEQLLYVLWDLKLEVGWGVRSPSECLALAARDHTARTALVDCRFLTGSRPIYDRLERAVLADLLDAHGDSFIVDKVEEMNRRRSKYGDSVFLLEPNLKQSEGGMRDLQSALWISRARFRVAGLTDLLRKSILPPSEVSTLRSARDFLWRTRAWMHEMAGRKEDRLTFDLQESVAKSMGYADTPEALGVESFMRDYYLAASAVKHAADSLVARCEEARRRGKTPTRPLTNEFKLWGGKVTLTDGELFSRDPAAVVRLFAVADREGAPLYSFARDKVAGNLSRLAEVVESPAVGDVLREMFSRPGTRGEFLAAMHEAGVFAVVLPEFARVIAKRQHDLYHVYTVDVHSTFATKKLYALRNGELAESEPELTRLMQELRRPLPLYLGMLFHDVGKGHGAGHSERGAEMFQSAARRLRLATPDAADAQFLILKHLAMSHVSQRRDLSDPALIRSFAAEMGSVERLTMLYLLTFADMCSVGPGVWTDWKARLLRELYGKTREVLESGGDQGDAATEVERARIALTAELSQNFKRSEVDAFVRSLPARYALATRAPDAARHLRVVRRVKERPLAALLVHRRRRSFTDVTLSAKDRPGLLAVFAGAFAAHRVDIMRADIFSTADGHAVDVFAVRNPRGGPLERERWRAVRADILAVLSGRQTVSDLLARRQTSTLSQRPMPRVPTKVTVDNAAAADATVIDVYAQDRIGLLYTIARAIYDAGGEIVLARIATEAHRAADGFYVQEGGKKIGDPARIARIVDAIRKALDGEPARVGAALN